MHRGSACPSPRVVRDSRPAPRPHSGGLSSTSPCFARRKKSLQNWPTLSKPSSNVPHAPAPETRLPPTRFSGTRPSSPSRHTTPQLRPSRTPPARRVDRGPSRLGGVGGGRPPPASAGVSLRRHGRVRGGGGTTGGRAWSTEADVDWKAQRKGRETWWR